MAPGLALRPPRRSSGQRPGSEELQRLFIRGSATLDVVRIAIDTNCLIGALVNPRSSCARIVRAWLDGRLEAVASESTVREAELVLGGRWLAGMVGRDKVDELLHDLRSRTIWAERPARIPDLRLKDEGDLRMVETAVAAGAQYVVTTDREFLSRRGYGDVEFVTPGELLRRLDRERQARTVETGQ